ncbi:MAG: hypothetical protein IAE80_27485 [Anaerolinea sp.]|nr:hypothetical protein [Anaerolinea sp.]
MTDETNLIPERDNEPIDPLLSSVEADAVQQADAELAPPITAFPETTAVSDESLWNAYFPDNGVDIDAALAAVASLNEPVTQQEAEDIALDAAPPPMQPTAYVPQLVMPPLSRLKRGHPGSLIPALLLIGLGAWLTLTTTSGATIDPLLVTAVVIGGAAFALLAQWIGSGRWSRGTLLFGVLIALVFALAFAVTRGINLLQTYPLILSAAGVALILAGVLSRPPLRRAFLPGMLLVAGGIAGMVVTMGILPSNWLPLAVNAAPVVALAILVLLIAPALLNRLRRPRGR